MAWGFDKPKTPPCTVSGDKHKWTFVRNGVRTQSSGGSLGSSVRITAVGIYRCVCSKQRYGRVVPGQPGADLRDHEKAAEK